MYQGTDYEAKKQMLAAGMMASGIGGTSEINKSPISEALARIERAQSRLENHQQASEARLSSVLPRVLAEGEPQGSESGPSRGCSPLADELNNIARRLERSADVVEALNRRIEL